MKKLLPDTSGARLTVLIAVSIGLLALGLRLRGIRFGFPNPFCGYDEPISTSLAMRYGRGDFRPDNYYWPTLYSYLLFVLYGAYYAFGTLFGKFHSLFEFQKLYFTDPQSFYLIGRLINVAAGTLTAVLFFFMAKKAYSRRVGALAALFLALNFLHIRESHYARPDILAGVFMAPAFIFMLSLKNKKEYFLTGMFVGLAASVKYQYVLILVPALAAHFLPGPSSEKKSFGARLREPGPAVMLLASFLAFFATSPYIVLHLGETLRSIVSLSGHERTLMALYGFKNSFDFHFRFSFLQGIGLPLLIAALLGILLSLPRPKKADLIFLIFGAVYYLVITLCGSIYMRYALPLLLPLLLFAAKFADACIGAADPARAPKPVRAAVTVLLLGALLYLPAAKVLSYTSLLTKKDTRVDAAEWIEANIPGGSRIACAAAYPLSCPVLQENKASLAGEIKGIITGYRHKFLLKLPEDPARPSYYLAQLYDYTLVMLWFNGLKTGPGTLQADIAADRIDYIVEILHYPSAVPEISPQLSGRISGSYTLLKEILPYSGSTPPSPVFDEPNGFYPPCADFKGVLRPGPGIRIWKTAGAGAAKPQPARSRRN